MNLTTDQIDIIETSGTMVVNASAGTGKTATMVRKIAKEYAEIKNHKVIAAITFTIKAAKEIKSRIDVDLESSFLGTINSFVLEEVIKPFYKDIEEIVSEDIEADYGITFKSYLDGITQLHETNIIGSYDSRGEKGAPIYNNFIFELAMNIVKNSDISRKYLSSKYSKIYIDEYQDCDEDMHNFFLYLNQNLGIDLFVVGDVKQSIYMWRGARPELFKSLFIDENFVYKNLVDNFRCSKQIQDYSNILHESTWKLFKNTRGDDVKIIFFNSSEHNAGEIISKYLIDSRSCAVLRYSNINSKIIKNSLNEEGHEYVYIKTPLTASITSSEAMLYMGIANYCINSRYSEYDFYDEIPQNVLGDNIKHKMLKKYLDGIKNSIDDEGFTEKVIELFNYLDIKITNKISCNIESLKLDLNDIECHIYFDSIENSEKYQKVCMTFHSSKGLEFDQVVLFAEDYNLTSEAGVYNHYVATTRAKKSLLILCDINNNINNYRNDLARIYSNYSTFANNEVKPSDIYRVINYKN